MTGGWFIAGTDTGVGKTAVTEAMLRAIGATGRRVVGMKPVASGCRRTSMGLRSEDAERLQAAGSVAVDYANVNPYCFEPPIAPELAAAQAGVEIRQEVIDRHFRELAAIADWVIVEGVGGWRAPLAPGRDMNHVARALGLPVVLVVGARLGCINHTLLTAEAMQADGCVLAGWVMNHVDPSYQVVEETAQMLRDRLNAPLLAHVGHQPSGDHWLAHGAAILSRLLG